MPPRGSAAASPGLDFVLIDGSFSDGDYIDLVPHVMALRPVAQRVSDLRSFVRCLAAVAGRADRKVARLYIVAMGNRAGFWIGKTWISAASLRKHRKEMGELAGMLAPGAHVVVHCHEDGLDPAVRRALSDAWGVKTVYAEVDFPQPMAGGGPMGLSAHGYKIKAESLRFESDENTSSIFYW